MKKKLFTMGALLAAITITVGIGCHNNTSSSTTPIDTAGNGNPKPAADSALYSFAIMGCNRIDNSDLNLATNPSTANIAQLDRTLNDVMNLSPRPNYLFLVGDLVLGKTTDTSVLGPELRAWRQHYEASPVAATGIKLVLVPGNHEFNDGTSSTLCEQKWIEVMAPYIAGNNGPAKGGPDNLSTDQSKLTYSFNYQDAHFVVMNTDPAGQGSSVPTSWIAQDFAAARSAGAKHIFALAHKPAYNWTNDGTTSLTTANRDALWSEMQTNHVEAMITAHNHVYRRLQPPGKSWMIIAGNGGSTLDSNLPTDQNFGFSVVSVMKSGKVITKAYARNFGAKYNASSSATTYPTTERDSADITWN